MNDELFIRMSSEHLKLIITLQENRVDVGNRHTKISKLAS